MDLICDGVLCLVMNKKNSCCWNELEVDALTEYCMSVPTWSAHDASACCRLFFWVCASSRTGEQRQPLVAAVAAVTWVRGRKQRLRLCCRMLSRALMSCWQQGAGSLGRGVQQVGHCCGSFVDGYEVFHFGHFPNKNSKRSLWHMTATDMTPNNNHSN